jgi:hypothetical protein
MITPSDSEDDNSFNFSILDKARIEDLSNSEKMEAESGQFKVQKLNNYYCLWLANNSRPTVFSTKESLITSLENYN